MEGIYPIIPAILMLVLVLLTRKVMLSLGTGIVVGALLLHNFSIIDSLKEVWHVFVEIFYADGQVETGSILLLSFLLLLGIMTALLAASGGSHAFGEWMIKRVKTRKGAQLMTIALGVIIFIDDYFNSLAVGQVARPLTDRHRISRVKLAYYIDSTSAPVTVISPISSWGAFIIGILGSIFAKNNITNIEPLTAFIQMIPLNFYALSALLLTFLVAYFNMDIGPMKKHEKRAMETGQLIDPAPHKAKIAGDLSEAFEPHQSGKIYHLLVPIGILIVFTVTSMFITGYLASDSNVTILTIFANTNVNISLFIGGLSAVIIGFIFHFMFPKPKAKSTSIFVEGLKTMLPAIYILIFAWMIGSIMGELNTGEYLARLVDKTSLSPSMLPFVFFLIAGMMALATGTSWGTFGIMLPIGAEVCLNTDMTMLLPVFAAILAGSVFGDHCTPISDTTILSSTGAGANHIDHVITQLPYALIAALSAGIGYLIIGLTNQHYLALIIALLVPVLFFLFQRYNLKGKK